MFECSEFPCSSATEEKKKCIENPQQPLTRQYCWEVNKYFITFDFYVLRLQHHRIARCSAVSIQRELFVFSRSFAMVYVVLRAQLALLLPLTQSHCRPFLQLSHQHMQRWFTRINQSSPADITISFSFAHISRCLLTLEIPSSLRSLSCHAP